MSETEKPSWKWTLIGIGVILLVGYIYFTVSYNMSPQRRAEQTSTLKAEKVDTETELIKAQNATAEAEQAAIDAQAEADAAREDADQAEEDRRDAVNQSYYYCWDEGYPEPHHLGYPVNDDHLCTVGELEDS